MPTQGERQNYLWRPNDNSSTTLLRYDLEAKHWLNAIKSNTTSTTATLSETLGFIGLLISLIINLLSVIVMGITHIIVWFIERRNKKIALLDAINNPPEIPFEDVSTEKLEYILKYGEIINLK